MAEPRIIIFDLETLPNMTEALKKWTQLSNYPGQTIKASIQSIICAGWKVFGEKKVNCINAWDFKEWKKNVNDDKKLCLALYEVLSGADAVVTQNGKRFDWKFLQTRLMFHGIGPLPKTPHIDTMLEARKNLLMFNNRLNTLGELVSDTKMDHEGWDLWVDVWHRNKKAMDKMERYCKQDVVLTEKVFKKLRPLITCIPNYNVFSPEYASGRRVCPMCGSTRITRNGVRYTKTSSYQRYTCKDCGGSCRTDSKGMMPRSL